MEKLLEWERRSKFFNLEFEEIKNLCKKFLIREDKFIVTKAKHGLANTNYIIEFENGDKFILRINVRDIELGKKEFKLSYLLHNEPLVPKFLSFNPINETTNYFCSFIEYREGNLLSDFLTIVNSEELGSRSMSNDVTNFSSIDYNPSFLDSILVIYSKLGEFLGNLNSYKFQESGLLTANLSINKITTKHNEYNVFINYILDKITKHRVKDKLGKQLSDYLKNKIISYEKFFPKEGNNQLVHGDFKPSNILVKNVDGTLILSGILDWEFAYSGSVYGDIATLFRFKHLFDKQLKESFASGYSKVSKLLDSDWEKKAKLVDLVNSCDLLDSEDERPNMYNNITGLIADIVN
ncbi:phosphotransferase [Rickettsia endosymbiont of Oedothorax gibbosus]|uniref:phosphotransferase n=1 Tax=Rickettsia endosymbiont of Oedothorax gibbosus TaxID=931099 RepID=UPI00202531C7|nr:phosphotransferase [Rickettsia endosymbiont of Oedothorax gibbosus]